MVTDGIMTAVQALIDRFSTPEEKIAGEAILDMLGDFDEDEWYAMDDEQIDEWLANYINE